MGINMGLLKDMVTCKDGESGDVVRVAMTVIIFLLPGTLLWGLGLETWAVLNQKTFDMTLFFNAIFAFLACVGTFLLTSAGALLAKHKTEPNDEAK